jgi:uncharacterized protein
VKLLADTSALVALALARERNHRAARSFVRTNPGTRFVLTELVLAEIATVLRSQVDAERAAAIARSYLASRRYEVIFVDVETLEGALDRMAKLADKRLSLVDCASFETIDRLGLDGAFTFDSDFRECGYVSMPF